MILLDTLAWLWWLAAPEQLGEAARSRIAEAEAAGELAVSAISVWEAAMLVKKGRLQMSVGVRDLVAHCEAMPGFRFVPLQQHIALQSVLLEPMHPDPADRFIVATAKAHHAVLVTKDQRLWAMAGLPCLW